MHTWMLLFAFPALFGSAYGVTECAIENLSCCLTEFESFVSPAGISLSEQKLASACTLKDETLECMDNFLDQCRNFTDQILSNLVNKTSMFISDVCPPTSDFVKNLVSNEECILNSSQSFQACYNRTLTPDTKGDEKKADCCAYKELRNCAVQTVENQCGATASQLVHDEVVNTNGAVLEWDCSDIFGQCGNSAVMLASSAFFVLYKIMLLKFLL